MNDFDVIVVGSGAGGGMTALTLCEAGFKVGLLEKGPRFDPSKDYVQNYPDWEQRIDPLDQARTKEQLIDRSYGAKYEVKGRKYTRSPLVYHRVEGLGGSTLHYQGEAHRFGEHCFEQNSLYGWGLDWPIGYRDLAPYYAQVETLLGVAGEPGNPFKPERGAFPTPAHHLTPRSQYLGKAAERAGMLLQANTLALPSVSVDGRLPCQHSGGCNFGCVFKAKSSIDQAILPRAEKTGNLTILTETTVLKLRHKGDRITGVEYSNQDETGTLRAKSYVLAGGALQTPRLLLHSQLGNRRDQVGRYFMETVVATHMFRANIDFRVYTGPPLDSRIWDFYVPSDNQTGGFVLGSAGYLYPATGPISYADRIKGIGRAHKQAMRDNFGKSMYLFGIAEQEPVASNRITLSDKTDDLDIPKVKVHCEYSQRDRHTLNIMQSKLALWQDAVPNSRWTRKFTTVNIASATHVAGTCRMGDDPTRSVVDRFGKIHDCDNGYITDGSVMPTQGAGDSPSLTIQALALRTAERISADLNKV